MRCVSIIFTKKYFIKNGQKFEKKWPKVQKYYFIRNWKRLYVVDKLKNIVI